MKSARLLGIVFVALLVSSVVGTSVAAAYPEFKPNAGKFTTTAGASKLVAGANTVTCTAESSGGEITAAATVGRVVVKFTGCKSTGSGGSNCTIKSAGGAEGEVATNTLKGELGTVKASEATSGVGLVLKPTSGTEFAKLEKNSCTAAAAVTGSVAGEASPIGSKQTTGKLIFAPGTTGEKIKEVHLCGGTTDEPELIAFSVAASQETSASVAFASATEIT
jgi:hypothetical protein